MKHLHLKIITVILFTAGITFYGCKSKKTNTTVLDTSINNSQSADTSVMVPAPVTISPDDSLTAMAKDAVKDYPDVTASVNNGEVTLTGNITREKLPKLMMAVSAMHPKKINNNLTIKN